MENKTSLQDSIKNIASFQDAIKKVASESDDVKDGTCTTEEELQEPAYVLYSQIAESSIKILQLPEVTKTFSELSNKIGTDLAKSMTELLTICMTQSAHQAILFYDDLLKLELSKQFDHLGEYLNKAMADIDGHAGALSVFKKEIGEIQNKLRIEKFTQDNNISTPAE